VKHVRLRFCSYLETFTLSFTLTETGVSLAGCWIFSIRVSCLLSYEGHSFYGKSLVRNDDSFKCVEGHMRRKLSATLLRSPTFNLLPPIHNAALLLAYMCPPHPYTCKGGVVENISSLIVLRPMLILGQSHCPLLHRGPPPIFTPTFKVMWSHQSSRSAPEDSLLFFGSSGVIRILRILYFLGHPEGSGSLGSFTFGSSGRIRILHFLGHPEGSGSFCTIEGSYWADWN